MYREHHSRADRLVQLRRILQRARVEGSITRTQSRMIDEHLAKDPAIANCQVIGPVIREIRSFPIHENPIRHLRILTALVILPIAIALGACEETATSREEWPPTCAVSADYESMECAEEGQQ
jgi:hypothetical protein